MAGFVDVAGLIGDNLARCRKKADLSQEELGLIASLHRTEISQLERGLRIPRADTIIKLSTALGVTTDDLFAGITWHPGDYRPGGFVDRGED